MIFEKHDAIVTSIADEEERGRIQVSCAGLMGDEDSSMPMWIEPNFDWGWFYVPDVGETVEIEMAVGSDTDESRGQTSLDTPDISWRGKRRWTSDEVEGQNVPRPIPDVFKKNYGKRRGLYTPAGHFLFFDDTEGGERIELTDPLGNSVSMGKDLVKVVSDKDVEVEATNVKVTADVVDLVSGDVKVGDGADNAIMRADDFITHMDAHTHATPMGPSGPPLVPTPANAKATTATVK